MLIADETIETASAWEWKIPLGLMIFGLPILVIHGLAIEGARGGATVLLGIGVLLLVYLPITIAAMFIAAPLVDLTFGEFGPAIAKIAGIYVFTPAIHPVIDPSPSFCIRRAPMSPGRSDHCILPRIPGEPRPGPGPFVFARPGERSPERVPNP